ncbi:MAG: thymidylate synthase, partial [Candidimonas sp.]
MKSYLALLERILKNGNDRTDRTGVGTRSLFVETLRFDLKEGFPAVTTKKLAWKSVVSELLWFLEGSTDERRLAEIRFGKNRDDLIDKTTIWTANADKQGKDLGYENTNTVKQLGPVYGKQWRDFGGIDQISKVINQIKSDPYNRRHIVSAWNATEIDHMALPPCHMIFQFYVSDKNLSCHILMRSTDAYLGLPFNIASYALLTHMVAHVTDMDVGELVITCNDCHIYNNHVDQVHKQIKNDPFPL